MLERSAGCIVFSLSDGKIAEEKMLNLAFAKLLYEIADILEMQNVQWKPNVYRRAARSIEALSKDIASLNEEQLEEIPGVGESIAKKAFEFSKTGKVKEFEKIRKSIPEGVLEMMHIPGIGPKKAMRLFKELNIKSIAQLRRAAIKEEVRKLEGFGAKSEHEILSGIGVVSAGKHRWLLGRILPVAKEIASRLQNLPFVSNAEVAGSIRRMQETCKDIDVLVISKNSGKVMDFFTKMSEVKKVLAKGSTKSTVILNSGIQADVRVLEEKSFGAALQYFTGNKDHNIKLRTIAIKKKLKLSEYGVFDRKGKHVAGRTEAEVYKRLGLPYIDPELRQDSGEIEHALKRQLPKLIPYGSIRGDLHVHTKWSDGNNSTEEMIKAAQSLGYEYVAITDHSQSQHIANGLDVKRLKKHMVEVRSVAKKLRIKVLFGSEVDILADGSLDYPKEILKQLDWIVGSIHSRFKSTKEEMTKRIITAIESGLMHVLGHPTGRLINAREPYDANLEKVFQAAKDNNVALEINSCMERLDLKDSNIRLARNFGCKFIINTDSHHTADYNQIVLGIAQARRGWLSSKDVLNTLPYSKFKKYLSK